MHPQTRIALLLVTLSLGACYVYTPETRQGNFIDQTKFDQVKAGMTREQVRFLLGPPMADDPFHRDAWNYFLSIDGKAGVRRHFLVKFENELVSSVTELD
jgi:outer membrane protein assembly factor BamE